MGEIKLGCMIQIFVMCYSAILVCNQQINVDVYKSELFVQKVSPDSMSWNDTERMNSFHYLVTSVEGPDLPQWIFTAYIMKENCVFIYGVAPIDFNLNIIELLVSFTSLHSYRSKYYKVIISVFPKDETEYAQREIRLRISNVNIQEMLSDSRRNEFKDIFENYLWPESKGKLYVTHMTESTNEGFRLPLNPNDALGVIIHLGSTANFSNELYEVQSETKPLSKHCPSFHKKISRETLFVHPNFIVDWCFFKLVDLSNCPSTQELRENTTGNKKPCKPTPTVTTEHKKQPLILFTNEEEVILTTKEQIPASPLFRTLVTLVIIPSVVLSVIITFWLVCIMCLQSSKLYDRYSDDYFETVFFICENCKRNKRKEDEHQSTLGYNEYNPDEALFHF